MPIKGDTATKVDIDPLVMQSYKSLMCFLTSWLVILLGQEVTFTWWGLVSGEFNEIYKPIVVFDNMQ